MLPFLKKDKVGGVLVAHINKNGKEVGLSTEQDMDDQDMMSDGLEECAQELIAAIVKRDSKAVASILRDMFQIMDALPHEEGPHIEE